LAGIVSQAWWASPTFAATSDYNVYVANQGNGTLSTIDSTANTVTGTVPVGQSPYQIAVSPDGLRVYTPNYLSGTVSVVDTITNSVIATIPVGPNPNAVFSDLTGSRIYVDVNGEAVIKVINAQTYVVEAQIPVSTVGTGHMSPDGSKLYISNQYGDSIFVIDTSTNMVTDTIPGIGPQPGQITVSPDGSRIYVSTQAGLTVVDPITHAVIATIPEITNGTPAITPDGSRIYATTTGTGAVKVLNTQTNTVIDSINIGSDGLHAVVSPDGSRVYVSIETLGMVDAIDTSSDSVIATIAVGGGPGSLAIGAMSHPITKDQCKDGGWMHFSNLTFKNQGECILFVNLQS